ncbi:MAG: hypothetical protein JSV86_16960 [Gemmatimonadota bacterium]|nr:MAG: hypothetical protein JSV86_16960 [Gemmatimonadota bacterium]
MAKTKKLSAKKLDALIEKAYYANCAGTMINIMDIGKVFKAGRVGYALDGEAGIEPAVVDAIATYGVPA